MFKCVNIPSCKNCIYYKPNSKDFESTIAKCQKFGSKDIVTDIITYDYASSCRNDESLCGAKGKYFEIEENIETKILLFNIVNNMPNFIIWSSFLFIYLGVHFL
jgi:hypothetical protein